MRKLKLFLILSVSLLALFTLSACKMLTAHKRITNIKFTEKTFKESDTKTVAKIEYQTVNETQAGSDIDYNTAFDLAVNQTATIKIAYYDNQNKVIATEYAPSIQDAIDQSHGIGSVMYYPESKGTHLEVSGKDEMTGDKSLSDTADFETVKPDEIDKGKLRTGDEYDGNKIAEIAKNAKRSPSDEDFDRNRKGYRCGKANIYRSVEEDYPLGKIFIRIVDSDDNDYELKYDRADIIDALKTYEIVE